jgi:hypothetical protein
MGLWKRTCEFFSRKMVEAKTFNEPFTGFSTGLSSGTGIVPWSKDATERVKPGS